ERAAERSIHPRRERVERRARRPVLLLHLVVDLLVVGDEEERLVALERTTEREAELMLAEVGLEALHRAAGETMLRRAGNRVELAEVVDRAPQLIGAGLRDDVDETGARPAELGRRAPGGDDDLLHGVEVERERWALAAALLSEEGVVEVGSVHRDNVEDAALAGDGELVAIRPLHDRDVGCEQRQIEVVAPVVRQSRDRPVREPRGPFA